MIEGINGRTAMNDRTASVLATVEKCTPEEKDAILAELIHDKWNREGHQPRLEILTQDRHTVGMFYPVIDAPIRSAPPNFTPETLAAIQEAVNSDEETFTTEEAIEYMHRELDRRYAADGSRGSGD
jgi:hypothetical protein